MIRSISATAVLFPLIFLHAEIDRSYLGVRTSRLDGVTSHQLGLVAGVHLQVDRVMPGSPAEEAGILPYDVLLKFEDQILVNPDQLKALVRMRNPGETVSLSLVRQSKRLNLSVELIESPADLDMETGWDWGSDRLGDSLNMDRFFGPDSPFRDLFRRHSFDFPNIGDLHHTPFFSNPRLGNQPGSTSPGLPGMDDPLHGNGTDAQSYSYSSTTKQITVNDGLGNLQWTEKDGLRFLRVTDLQGRVVYEGPITSEEDRRKLPDGVGERLRAMQESGQIPGD